MPVIPSKFQERVEFFQNRIALWTENSTNIGLTAGEVTALNTKVTSAAAAMAAAQVARDDAKSATVAAHDAILALTDDGAELIRKIKAKAGASGNSVYTLANIPVPATPSPKPPPGTPEALKVTLNGNGALNLKWKCTNPPGSVGTIYQVWRRVGTSGEFVYLGGAGTREFEDATVPAPTASVTYQIQAVRSTAVGQWAQFNVNFGVSTGGPTIASVVAQQPSPSPKMAA
jgi:hypothetical protein